MFLLDFEKTLFHYLSKYLYSPRNHGCTQSTDYWMVRWPNSKYVCSLYCPCPVYLIIQKINHYFLTNEALSIFLIFAFSAPGCC